MAMHRPLVWFAAGLVVHTVACVWLRRGVRKAQAEPSPEPSPETPLSVVVAAKNEAKRLAPLMAALDAQTHGPLEIVVVDDESTDGTRRMLDAWASRNPKVSVVGNSGPPGKKGALATGIAAARHDALALTDADCAPPPGWAASLAKRLAPHPSPVVVGYAPYRRAPGLLNAAARYETLVTGMLTAAAVGQGHPYMAVGRNLGLSKDVFAAVNGYDAHAHLLSGDDDLFVQDVHRIRAARMIHPFDADSYVPSDAPTTWRGWMHQKTRHLSDGRHYPTNVQTALTVYHLTAHLLWLAPLVSGWPGAALLAARLTVHGWALRPFADAVGETDLVAKSPALELVYTLHHALLAPRALLGTLRRW